MIKKVKNNVPWTYVISDFNGEEIVGTFYENKLQKKKKYIYIYICIYIYIYIKNCLELKK